jgi:hypothetical protein
MIGYVEAPRAFGLLRGMGRATGVELIGAVTEGWVSRRELADLVAVCEGCTGAEACQAWLATHIRAEAPPRFCGNGAALRALSPQG